ncbi:alpha/beta hydrolase family protein [Ktedonosporobacter rubrisoli]|uniref:alpha/beta hydrolase family protein n=1 Tax=Ktedonosporobacter rubrisoli TaxID=2509675 RepID=UPI0013EE6882|nr:alpha/beta fold hydrolase [Ktedonosporobacter rubrisoli]
MRTFEIILILLNVLTLFLSLKKPPKGVWLGVAGINLFTLLLQILCEGFRYQMVFSYLFVVLLVIFALLKTGTKFSAAKLPKALKVTTISLSLILLAFTSLLAYALPVFTLPKPTGSTDVGIKYFHLVDQKRNEPFLDKSQKKRELMVKIYYPGKKDDSKPYSPYFHGSTELLKLFAEAYSMPDFMLEHLRLVKTYTRDDLQLSDQQASYPVVLFSHGGGTTMEVHTSQCEDLASHGYIVVAIDHTYISAGSIFPDRIVSARQATTQFNSPDPADIIDQIMVEDDRFVMDELAEMNEGKIASIFMGRLDLQHIGVIGHSLGGAVAYNLAINDRRVKAAINLDGSVYVTPKAGLKNVAPFLMLANDENHIQAIQQQEPLLKKFADLTDEQQKQALEIYGSKEAYAKEYEKALQSISGLKKVLQASENLYTIEGSAHMKFTDIGLFFGSSQLRDLIGIHGQTDPTKCLEITQAVTVAFFDQHLKGETNASLHPLFKKYQELKNVALN